MRSLLSDCVESLSPSSHTLTRDLEDFETADLVLMYRIVYRLCSRKRTWPTSRWSSTTTTRLIPKWNGKRGSESSEPNSRAYATSWPRRSSWANSIIQISSSSSASRSRKTTGSSWPSCWAAVTWKSSCARIALRWYVLLGHWQKGSGQGRDIISSEISGNFGNKKNNKYWKERR